MQATLKVRYEKGEESRWFRIFLDGKRIKRKSHFEVKEGSIVELIEDVPYETKNWGGRFLALIEALNSTGSKYDGRTSKQTVRLRIGRVHSSDLTLNISSDYRRFDVRGVSDVEVLENREEDCPQVMKNWKWARKIAWAILATALAVIAAIVIGITINR